MVRNPINRRQATKLLGTSIIGGIAGCSGGGSNGEGGSTPTPNPTNNQGGSNGGQTATPEPTQKTQSAQLALSHYPAVTSVAVAPVTGIKKGFFEENGVTIEDVVSFSGGGATLRGITTGGIAFGGGGLNAAVNGFLAGAPLQIIGMYLSSPDFDIMVRPDSDFESIQDLKGETISCTNPGSSTQAAAIATVKNADGISLDEVSIKPAGGLGEAITATSEGLSAACVNVPPVSQQMEAAGKLRRIAIVREYEPHLVGGVFYAGQRTVDENPELLNGIMHGMSKSYDYVKNNVEECAKIWADVADVDDELAIEATKFIKPETIYDISIDETDVKTTVDAFISLGAIDQQPPWDDLIDQQFLPEDKRVDWVS